MTCSEFARLQVGNLQTLYQQACPKSKRIIVDPGILVGKPTIRGMRLSVEQILDALVAGVPEQELLEDYPGLEPDGIRAVLLYARDVVASERVYPVDISVPA